MTDHLLVQGRCPACNGSSLFLGTGGHVTCSRLDCTNPCAADDLLHRGRPAPGAWLLEGTRDLSIPQHTPHLTARSVSAEEERAATNRARQAAADSEAGTAWVAAHSSPHPAETALTELLGRFKPVPGYPDGLISHPLHPEEYERWRTALSPRAQQELDIINGREEPRTTADNQAATEATMPRGTPCVCGGIAPAHDQHAGEHRPMGAP